MSNSNTESNTISNVTSFSSQSSTRKNKAKASNAVAKRKANFNAAKQTLKNASNSQTNGKWKPRASNITGLVGVRRRQGDEKTFINHAISRWEKRQINRNLAAEEKKKGKEVVVPTAVEPAVVVNATAKVQKKRGRPKLTNQEKAQRKANRTATRKAERNQKKQTAKNKKANKK